MKNKNVLNDSIIDAILNQNISDVDNAIHSEFTSINDIEFANDKK